MKKLITLCIIAVLLTGCSININRTTKTEASLHLMRKGDKPKHVDFDNQSSGNATDKALRKWKKDMNL